MENSENVFSKILTWIKSHIVLVAIIAVAIIAIVLVLTLFVGGPKRVVKKFISSFNGKNGEKLVECIDFKGTEIWYEYDEDKFTEDDYKEFLEDYKAVDEEDAKETKKDMKKSFNDEFEDYKEDYKTYKMKVEEFKDVEKIAKDLYVVKAKISVLAVPKDKDEDEIDETSVITFVVYKNKIIDFGYIL